jgi:hypothetical protein
MLQTGEHIRKARHNEDFVATFDHDTTLFLDWVVNGYFYAALHYVGAYFKEVKRTQSSSHKFTDDQMMADANLDRIYNDYLDLKNDSQQARYLDGTFDPDYVKNSCRARLESIKNSLAPFLPPI